MAAIQQVEGDIEKVANLFVHLHLDLGVVPVILTVVRGARIVVGNVVANEGKVGLALEGLVPGQGGIGVTLLVQLRLRLHLPVELLQLLLTHPPEVGLGDQPGLCLISTVGALYLGPPGDFHPSIHPIHL